MPDTIPLPTFEVEIPAAPISKGELEYRAFRRLLPDLLKSHRGRYVAIHEERVVDMDDNDIALIQRVHARVGYVPIYVGLVEDPLPIFHVPHYREYRAETIGV
jgi:hypothetical protein